VRVRLALLCAVIAGCSSRSDRKPQDPSSGSGDGSDGSNATTARDAAAEPPLPPAPPLPDVPAGLPPAPVSPAITPEAVALGELLFWDTRLSSTNKTSCATCHEPEHGFAGAARRETAAGKPNLRRAPTLVNLAWQKELGWDGRYAQLTEHLAAHVRGQLGGDLAEAMVRISDVPGYRQHLARAGGAAGPADTALAALAAYVSTRYEGGAPWDRLERAADVPAELKAGYLLFTSRAQCAVCHTPPLYTDLRYHRLGLIKSPDGGRGLVDPAQQGAFKTPTLRGAAAREGFFHDGSAATLDEAIDWHLAGGTGQGADRSIIDPAIKKIALTAAERAQLGAFVRALTDATAQVPRKPALP
jgi:cytochrome c peroxidase